MKDFPGGAVAESTWQGRRRRRCGFDPRGRQDPLEEEMATHSSCLAWRIPCTEEPGGLQSVGVTKSQMIEHAAHAHEYMQGSSFYMSLPTFICHFYYSHAGGVMEKEIATHSSILV